MELVIFGAIGIALMVFAVTTSQRSKAAKEESQRELVAEVKGVVDEDVTVFGEELQDLHIDTMTTTLDQAMRQDYQRALNSYETAKSRLDLMEAPDDARSVTQALEDGRYAMACVRARQAGDPLPTRRSPCFFNPQHGPSTTDISWAPPGGQPRDIPVCAADADRVQQGAEPDIRVVGKGRISTPYWQSGPAYRPYAMGYYSSYADILPLFVVMSMLNPMWLGGAVDGFDTGGYGDAYSDGSADGSGDGYGDSSGDGGSGGDAGGDVGGGDGFFDGGGIDFGGF